LAYYNQFTSLLVGKKEYKNVDHHCFALISSEINSVYEQVETKQNPIFNFAKDKTKQVAQKKSFVVRCS